MQINWSKNLPIQKKALENANPIFARSVYSIRPGLVALVSTGSQGNGVGALHRARYDAESKRWELVDYPGIEIDHLDLLYIIPIYAGG